MESMQFGVLRTVFFLFSFWDDVVTCSTLECPLQVGNELLVEFKYLRISFMFKERKDGEVTDAAAALIRNVLVCCGEEDQSVYIHTLT